MDLIAAIAEASQKPVPDGALTPQVPYDMLGDTDVLLRVDLRVYTRSGEEFKVAGVNTIPHILSTGMHIEAPHLFEDMFNSVVARPLLAKFNGFLNEHTKIGSSNLLELQSTESRQEPVLTKGFIAEE